MKRSRRFIDRVWEGIRTAPIYPFLFALYPAAALLASNIDQVKLVDTQRAYMVSFVFGLALVGLMWLFLRDWAKAALLAALVMLLFFSYGHAYDALSDILVLGVKLGRHLVMIPLWVAIFGFAAWRILHHRRDLQAWTSALNLMSLFVLIYPFYQIASYELLARPSVSEEDFDVRLVDDQQSPDIYYIILDAYSREDVLREFYGFDDSEFLQALQERGFVIAGRSQSNYALSALSLASSLNFDYLDNLEDRGDSDRFGEGWLKWLVRESKARRAFESLGYRLISFETGFRFTEIDDADIYYSKKIRDMNAFEAMLVNSTALRILTALENYLPDFLLPDIQAPFEGHRERILYVLEKLEQVAGIGGHKFVFAHIVSPHSPYVFDADGGEVKQEGVFSLRSRDEDQDWEYHVTGYTNQILHINRRILPIIDSILAQSEIPPVIILQGDHGGPLTSEGKRMAIFNAYFLPGDCREQVYPNITPVNTFRVVFNCYFDGQYELLDDIAYFSTYDNVFNYLEIPNE